MTRLLRMTLAFGAILATSFGAGINGNWKMSADAPDGNNYKFTLAVKGSGSEMSADLISADRGTVALKEVAFANETLSFKLPYGEIGMILFKLKLDGDTLKGTLATEGGDTGTVQGTREAAAAAGAANVSGKWTVVAKSESGREVHAQFDLKQDGEKVTGDLSTDQGSIPISDGKVAGDQFTFTIQMGGGYDLKGTVKGGEIKGAYKSADGNGLFVATKN
jgi:hypothetical protein